MLDNAELEPCNHGDLDSCRHLPRWCSLPNPFSTGGWLNSHRLWIRIYHIIPYYPYYPILPTVSHIILSIILCIILSYIILPIILYDPNFIGYYIIIYHLCPIILYYPMLYIHIPYIILVLHQCSRKRSAPASPRSAPPRHHGTAPPQVSPAPKPQQAKRSPFFTRPSRIASGNFFGRKKREWAEISGTSPSDVF